MTKQKGKKHANTPKKWELILYFIIKMNQLHTDLVVGEKVI